MILYYAPGACSLADHIALVEAGVPHRLVKVGRDKRTSDGRDFRAINPKGYVPALELDDGTVLTENLVILAYLAHESGSLLPEEGLPRWRVWETTAFMATELHRRFGPFFYPNESDRARDEAREALSARFALVAAQLAERAFLFGDRMTFADPYLFVMLMWAKDHAIPVPPSLDAYFARMNALPSVVRALAAEGL